MNDIFKPISADEDTSSRVVTVRLDGPDYARMRAAAKEARLPITRLAKQAIMFALDRMENPS